MSQAHYLRCGHLTPAGDRDYQCPKAAVARLAMPYLFSPHAGYPACKEHMDSLLDSADELDNPFRHEEPLSIEWLWDAGTRTCPLHHWPDVLCRDLGDEHAALIRALLGTAVPMTGGAP